jgi:hypothetical protein
MTKRKPWKPSEHSRKCMYAKCPDPNKPGMQSLRLFVRGKSVRGYWHLPCFEKSRKDAD